MEELYIGKKLTIQCYKHDGKIHRSWDEAVLLDIKKDYLVFANNKTTVIESQGNYWKTREPAIMYFFKDCWYNVIAQMKKDGIYYYCNIATPYIIEENTIKYIDYDLDLRIFPDESYKILDQFEFNLHRKKMNYSDDLSKVITKSLDELIDFYSTKPMIFSSSENMKYNKQYNELKKFA